MANDDKAKLFRRLFRASLHAVLERMRVHGFWPTGVQLPEDPPEEAKERARLEQQLSALASTSASAADVDAALKVERARRWKESKERRAARKAALQQARDRRREEYAAYRRGTVVHAGEGVSSGLDDTSQEPPALLRRGLPVVLSAQDLAAAMGLSLSRLRWLTFHRRAVTVVHYHRYVIPKKAGGVRNISAPKPDLARAQRWILEAILSGLVAEPQAHGFVAGRSIVSNAAPHVGRRVVLNIDVRDFFPSVTFPRVKGLFRKLGYNGHVATLLALLCTEPPRVAATLDQRTYFVATEERRLPQGACTSPAITNALCRRLDRRLAGLARRHGAAYTRYADDLTFSLDDDRAIGKLLSSVRALLRAEGFFEHEAKTRVMRRARRQEVTGVTVNERLSIPRVQRRQLRAILHRVRQNGLEAENRDHLPDFEAHLRGRIAFVHMVDPTEAQRLYRALDDALAQTKAG